MRRLLPRIGLLAGLAVLASIPAHAQAVDVLDTIVSQFQTRAAGWEGTLTTLATQTFGILAAIELAWAGFRLAFRGSDVSEWLAGIVNQILFLGFFLPFCRTPPLGAPRSSTASGRRGRPPAASASPRPMSSRPA